MYERVGEAGCVLSANYFFSFFFNLFGISLKPEITRVNECVVCVSCFSHVVILQCVLWSHSSRRYRPKAGYRT